MRELTKAEQKIVDQINRLQHITISNLLKKEFAGIKFTMDKATVNLYSDQKIENKAALDVATDEVSRMVNYCIDCIRVLELLESQGLLYRLQHILNFDGEREFDGSAISTVTKKEAAEERYTIHLFPYKGVAEKVEELDKWFYVKTESLPAFISDGYALPSEARERKNLKIAVAALVITVMFSFIDLNLTLAQADVSNFFAIVVVGATIGLGLVIYWDFNK
jgi:hypothetical protein